ncbi:MAG: FlaA1/EpsC-like NDP-sugar epimerase, partial [Flavobacteriales bacterium]
MKFPENNIQRWVIFVFDVLAACFALFVAYALRFDFFSSKQDFSNELEMLKTALPIFIVIRVVLFYFGKTYAGIIRYTSTEDAKRIFKVVTIGTGIFILFSIIKYKFWDGTYFLPRPIIAIEYLLTLFFMIATRLGVKLIYHEGRKDKENTKNVIIYGAGEMGSIVFRTLNESANIMHNVIAFIDDNPAKSGNILQGVKVYHTSKLESLINKNNIDNIIVSIQNPSNENRSKVLDIALNNDLTVLNVPPVENWIDGQINVKQIQKIKIEDILGRKEISLSMDKISNSTKGKTILITGA